MFSVFLCFSVLLGVCVKKVNQLTYSLPWLPFFQRFVCIELPIDSNHIHNIDCVSFSLASALRASRAYGDAVTSNLKSCKGFIHLKLKKKVYTVYHLSFSMFVRQYGFNKQIL